MQTIPVRAGIALVLFSSAGILPAQTVLPARTPVSVGRTVDSVVNAPVAPEAIYFGTTGAAAGVGVIDMNGYGQGTGSLAITNFPQNPNLGRPDVIPQLAPGTSSLDAGGAGPATLTEDSIGRTVLTVPGRFGRVIDLQIGQPLDLVFNNENVNPFATSASQINPATGTAMAGNTISVAPHPNPPRIVLPPPNPVSGIVSEEPTVTTSVPIPGRVTTSSPPCVASPINLLGIGDPFGGVPGLFGTTFDGVFYGPPTPPTTSPPPPAPYCLFTSRQQVGHFLYALDTYRNRIAVLNSNRFVELASIPAQDPTAMAMAPNLRWLAVANDAPGTVAFIDVDPRSPTFHQVLQRAFVGQGRKTLAWQPEGEDLLVANRDLGQLTLISGATLQPRKVLQSRLLTAPMDVVATARQTRIGFNTGTWFGYVLNADGTIAIFESGPDTIGYDDLIGTLSNTFAAATTMQPDVTDFGSAFYIAHQNAAGRGTVSRVELAQSARDPQPVGTGRPNKRGRVWSIAWQIGAPLSGDAIVDLACDDMTNRGAWPDARSSIVPGLGYAEHSGKGHVKIVDGAPTAAHAPRFLFVAAADTGKIDLIDLQTRRVVRTLDAPGVSALAGYWRQ